MVPRRSRAGERGMTLIEVLVSVTIIGVLMGAVMLGFDIGVKAMGHGGAADRAAGAHDLSSFEQELGQDVSRSACISIGATAYGACSHSVKLGGAVISQCTTAVMCVAWSQSVGSNVGCHVDVYSQPGGGNTKVVRREYLDSSGTLSGLTGVNVTSPDGVAMSVVATPLSPAPPSGVAWVSLVSITITGSGVSTNPASGVLRMKPMASDPGGQAETVLC